MCTAITCHAIRDSCCYCVIVTQCSVAATATVVFPCIFHSLQFPVLAFALSAPIIAAVIRHWPHWLSSSGAGHCQHSFASNILLIATSMLLSTIQSVTSQRAYHSVVVHLVFSAVVV